jgi:signal transduction histidine kinase
MISLAESAASLAHEKLRIGRSIVESHGGRLWVAGAAGRGAIFQFTLGATGGDRS